MDPFALMYYTRLLTPASYMEDLDLVVGLERFYGIHCGV